MKNHKAACELADRAL